MKKLLLIAVAVAGLAGVSYAQQATVMNTEQFDRYMHTRQSPDARRGALVLYECNASCVATWWAALKERNIRVVDESEMSYDSTVLTLALHPGDEVFRQHIVLNGTDVRAAMAVADRYMQAVVRLHGIVIKRLIDTNSDKTILDIYFVANNRVNPQAIYAGMANKN